ncbi:MAG TPA: PIG-L family deacetylase, partial [bacterium]|nr:PIG-L family deacetylase [bacterium]
FATISGYPSAYRDDISATSARVEEAQGALQVLGAAGYEALFLGEEKHLRLDTVPQSDLIGFIERGLRKVRPSLMVIPSRGHYHQDHRAVSDACVAAMRPAPAGARPLVPLVLAYGHAHGGWGGPHYGFAPSAFVDVTGVIDRKLEALASYRSQLCDPPHPRSLPALRDHCATWGAFAGVPYAEPFECLRFLVG